MEQKNKSLNSKSLITLGINFLCLIAMGIIATKFSGVYSGFNLELPFATKMVFAWPYFVFVVLAILVVKEFLSNKKITFAINLLFLILLLGILVINFFLPMFKSA